MLNYKKTNKSSSKRSAFTLIELSIVLIIIGLLVAGITGGASLIKAAELRAVMAEARDYKIAANAFLVKYDNLPGDHDVVVGNASAGNADGTIDNFSSDSVLEGSEALEALYGADMGGLETATSAIIPNAKIKTAGWIFGSRDIAKNVILLTGSGGISTPALTGQNIFSIAPNNGVSFHQADSMDRKMDDGVLDTGRIRSYMSLSTVCADTNANGSDYIHCSVSFDL